MLFSYLKYTSKNTKNDFFCKKCKKGFQSPLLKNTHFCAKNGSGFEGRFRCNSCSYETPFKRKIINHVKNCKIEKQNNYDLKEWTMHNGNSKQINMCPFCFKGFSDGSIYRDKHITECQKNKNRKIINQKIWECVLCEKRFFMKTAAITHVQNHEMRDKLRGGGIPNFRYVEQKIEFNIDSLNADLISSQIYEKSIEKMRENLGNSNVKAFIIFDFLVGKNIGEPSESIWHMYFNVPIVEIREAQYKSIVKHWADEGILKFYESQNMGSGYQFININSGTIISYLYTDSRKTIGKGGQLDVLPLDLDKNIIKFLNTKNNGECFLDCLIAWDYIQNSENPFVKKITRATKKIKAKNFIDFKILKFSRKFLEIRRFLPMDIRNISKIESKIEPYTLNVYKLVKNCKEKSGYLLNKLFISRSHKNEENTVINLLLFKNHYYLIENLSGVVSRVNGEFSSKNSHRVKTCYNCLNSFDLRYTNLESHLDLCLDGIKSQISYAEKGDTKDFIRYDMCLKKPFFIMADFESSLLKIPENEKFKSSNTVRVNNHSINTVCSVLHIEDNLYNFPYEKIEPYRLYIDHVKDDTENECTRMMNDFLIILEECAEILLNWVESIDETTQGRQLWLLKRQHWEEHMTKSRCMICKNEFENNSSKCFHHDHLRNKYLGALCLKCNFRARKSAKLDVFFHNASYDTNFIIQNLTNFSDDQMNISMRGQKVNTMVASNLRIRDSFALLPLSLSKLGKKLQERECVYQNKYLPFGVSGCKDLFPYKFVDTVEKLKTIEFPDYENFENDVADMAPIEDYMAAKEFYKKNFKNLKEYLQYYVKKDVYLAIDVLLKNRDNIFEFCGLDLLSAYSLADLSLNALLKEIKGKTTLPIIHDKDIYNMFLEGLKGGISWASLRHSSITENRKNIDTSFYFDLKSSYANAFTMPLSLNNWEFLNISTVEGLLSELKSLNTETEGLLVKIDLHCPKETHDFLNDMPILYEKKSFDKKYYPDIPGYENISKVRRLIGHLGPSTDYVCLSQELLLMISLGVVVTKVTSVVKFNSDCFAKSFVERLCKLRQEAIINGDDSLAFIIKTILNSIFGKTILNKLKYSDTKLVTTEEKYEKKVASFRFKRASIHKGCAITVSATKKIKMDSLIHIGCSILATSKVVLLSYFYSLKKYILAIKITPLPVFRCHYCDTDSLIVFIKNVPKKILYELLSTKLNHLFDFSNIQKDHPLYSTHNQFKIGVLKIETEDNEIKEVNASSSKTYNLTFFDNENFSRAKGVPRSVSKKFSRKDFRQSHMLFSMVNNANLILCSEVHYFAIEKWTGRQMFTYKSLKRVLNPFDLKRFVISHGLDSLALGHWRIDALKKSSINCVKENSIEEPQFKKIKSE